MIGARCRRRLAACGVASITVLGLAACSSTAGGSSPTQFVGLPGRPDVYMALGASETFGLGLGDQALRLRFGWPQLFFNEALDLGATYYNVAVPGTTLAAALRTELPRALAVHPTVATLFFGVNDLASGVSARQFESDLGDMVHALRQNRHTLVLVANTPHIDGLPAYRACRNDPTVTATCPLGKDVVLPEPAVVDSLIDAYDAAVNRVAAREGAIVVDLTAPAIDLAAHPEYVSADGLHPSPLGHQAIARLFAAAYRAHRP